MGELARQTLGQAILLVISVIRGAAGFGFSKSSAGFVLDSALEIFLESGRVPGPDRHPEIIERSLRKGAESRDATAQRAHHLRRVPGPEGVDPTVHAEQRDVTAVLGLEPRDDRAAGIGEDAVGDLVGHGIRSGRVRVV